jgi:hypothetical protein
MPSYYLRIVHVVSEEVCGTGEGGTPIFFIVLKAKVSGTACIQQPFCTVTSPHRETQTKGYVTLISHPLAR